MHVKFLKYATLSFFTSVLLVCSVALSAEKYSFSVGGKAPNRAAYEADLIQLLFDETESTYGKASLVLDHRKMSTLRVWKEASKGIDNHIITSSNWPAIAMSGLEITRIEMPIQKGLLGYRKCIVRLDQTQTISDITTVDAFRKLIVGQGAGWQDVSRYRDNGMNVVTTTRYENLVPMLLAGRFGCLPLGILEVEDFVQSSQSPELRVIDETVIFYQLDVFFGVSNKHPRLIERLNTGLKMVADNGKFDQVFNKHYHPIIEKMNNKTKRVFFLKTKQDPETFPALINTTNILVLSPD